MTAQGVGVMAVKCLRQPDIVELHGKVMESCGQTMVGTRDWSGLVNAVERHTHGPFELGDLAERAALLMRAIVQERPFIDGNKRTGFVAANVFLLNNNQEIYANVDELVSFVHQVARGMHIRGIRAWISNHMQRCTLWKERSRDAWVHTWECNEEAIRILGQ